MRVLLTVIIGVFWTINMGSQTRELTLADIWTGNFTPSGLKSIKSMRDGAHFTILERNDSTGAMEINRYVYATGNKDSVLFDGSNFPTIQGVFAYDFSPDERGILIKSQRKGIYRRSYYAQHYFYDLNSGVIRPVEGNQLQEVTFSPDGRFLSFVKDNNLFYQEVKTGKNVQVTVDGRFNEIINGKTDWVYEEEFGFVRAHQWSSDGQYLAFLRFDETQVPEFSMDIYGQGLYPNQDVFKYPKAGDANASVTLLIHDLNNGETKMVDLSAWPYEYIPRIKWSKSPRQLSVQLMNRTQNHLILLQVDAHTNLTKMLLEERDSAYVEVHDDLTFLNDNSFIWPSEQDGWRHLYHYDAQGGLIQQLTKGSYDVTDFFGFNPKSGRLYFQSSKRGSRLRDLYYMNISGGNTIRLSQKKGTNSADYSADFSYFIQTHSSVSTPPHYTLHSGLNGQELRVIEDNSVLSETIVNYTLNPKTFDSIWVNGHWLNTYTIKPVNLNPEKKYPVLMYQYSGPGSQQVADRWHNANDYWHQFLVNKGIIVVCVDGRGTGQKGRDFKKMTQGKLGKYEVEDQIQAAKQIGEWSFVDSENIGIWGWSYGGFMSANCLFQGQGVFSTAISVAPVTSWCFYDTIYTERYMGLPQENNVGYDAYAPLDHVQNMQGNLLIVHGTADDNVHVQNSMRLIDALVSANKEFDWLIYPDKNHGIYGGHTRLHLYRKMTEFLVEHLMHLSPLESIKSY